MIKPFDARFGKRLPKHIISNLRFFGYYIGNETLLLPDDTDMSVIYEQSNALGELYMLKIFGTYNIDYSYIDKRNEIKSRFSIKAYIESLNVKSFFDLPLKSNEIKNGTDWRYSIIRFMFDIGNRNLHTQPLINFEKDYCSGIIDYGSSMEMITAIFCNTLRMDKQFNITNENWVRYRTSQYIRLLNDDNYVVVPKFKEWEMMLWL